MSTRQIRTVSLSRELDRFITEKVESGLYVTASEVVRTGLRQLANMEPKRPAVPSRDSRLEVRNLLDRAKAVTTR